MCCDILNKNLHIRGEWYDTLKSAQRLHEQGRNRQSAEGARYQIIDSHGPHKAVVCPG